MCCTSMGAKRWQIGDSSKAFKRLLKKHTRKWWRKQAKLDPENAPTRLPTKGYD